MLNICDLAMMIDCDNTGNMGSDAFVGNHNAIRKAYSKVYGDANKLNIVTNIFAT